MAGLRLCRWGASPRRRGAQGDSQEWGLGALKGKSLHTWTGASDLQQMI